MVKRLTEEEVARGGEACVSPAFKSKRAAVNWLRRAVGGEPGRREDS